MTTKTTQISLKTAKHLALDLATPAFLAGVKKADEDGLSNLVLKAVSNPDGSVDVSLDEPTGVMVAFPVPHGCRDLLMVPGGVAADQLHVTISYLGEVADMSLTQQRNLIGVIGQCCMDLPVQEVTFTGTGTFKSTDGTAFWVGVEGPGLEAVHVMVAEALVKAGIPVQDHATYQPHVTVAYLPDGAAAPPVMFNPVTAQFRHMEVAIGGHVIRFDLQCDDQLEMPAIPAGWSPEVVGKSINTVEPQMYTLAPWYVPDQLDAHGEFTDKANIEKSFWDYMTKAPAEIRHQHKGVESVIGHRVDGVVWPFEVTVPLKKADGTTVDHTFPAGTPWLGVKWEPEGWDMVTSGKLLGYSIGGTAKMLEVNFDGETSD